MIYICKVKSPVGLIHVASDGKNIIGLWIQGQKYFAKTIEGNIKEENLPVFEKVKKWLDIYFTGEAPSFLPPLAPKGSKFREQVWKKLLDIPFGKTTTYGEIAKQLEKELKGKRVSAQAVGGAVGHNPISIIIPCHRVIGADGSLTGYAGGLDKKVKLLKNEKVEFRKGWLEYEN